MRGPCDLWVDPLDLLDDPRLCEGGSGDPTPDMTPYARRATEAMWVITGRRFGVCSATVRPVKRGCSNSCIRSCSDDDGILLHDPIVSVDEVRIDGLVVSDYHVRNHRSLHRNSGRWPTRQNLGAPNTDPDTFSITYTFGVEPPEMVKAATAELAIQYWLLDEARSDCQLPMGTTSVSRQGMTVDIDRALQSSTRIISDAAASYPLGVPADAWFASDWELLVISP